MKKLVAVFVAIILATTFMSCEKEEIQPTAHELIQGNWTLDFVKYTTNGGTNTTVENKLITITATNYINTSDGVNVEYSLIGDSIEIFGDMFYLEISLSNMIWIGSPDPLTETAYEYSK